VAWKSGWTKAPANAPFWYMLWTSYEVMEQEQCDVDGIEIGISHSRERPADQVEENILTHYYHMACSTLDPDYVPETLSPRSAVHSSNNNNKTTALI
jgi:hypothetical protein